MDITHKIEEQRNSDNIPREMKRLFPSLGVKLLLGFSIFSIVTMLIFSLYAMFAYGRDESTQGIVSQVDYYYDTIPQIAYEFSIGTDVYKDSISLGYGESNLNVGDTVKVSYNEKNPLNNRIDADPFMDSSLSFLFPLSFNIVFWMLIVIIPVSNAYRKRNKVLKLWKNGKTLLAKLIHIKRVAGNKKWRVTVEFEYNGKSIETEIVTVEDWFVNQWKREEVITLIVDENEPENVLLVEEYIN